MSLIWKITALGAIVVSVASGSTTTTSNEQQYSKVSFFVCAHQDDWQLFMGRDAFDHINNISDGKGDSGNNKVVIIYTTAGNLNDEDDTKTCDCRDTHKRSKKKIPYWKVREIGAKNSVHLAACKLGGYGPGTRYPANNAVKINGHEITRYAFKNTVSYFLRIKAVAYGKWYDSSNFAVGTMDNSSTYTDRADLVNTLSAIYEYELKNATDGDFHMPDTDEKINPNDHHDHITAGRSGLEAVQKLSQKLNRSFAASLFTDYHTENLPANLGEADTQNEAALTAVYCLALLDYNAWPEWGAIYQKWTTRNYSRTITVSNGK